MALRASPPRPSQLCYALLYPLVKHPENKKKNISIGRNRTRLGSGYFTKELAGQLKYVHSEPKHGENPRTYKAV